MRNPFSVPDVHDPTGPDVEAFAERLPVTPLDGDESPGLMMLT